MKYILTLLLLKFYFFSVNSHAEVAITGASLKKAYVVNNDFTSFYQTGKYADSYSMICEMEQAILDPSNNDQYISKPSLGLKLELRARATYIESITNIVRPIGFVVAVEESGNALISFTPLGKNVNGLWDGDVFNSWNGVSSEVNVHSGDLEKKAYAHFDLLDGTGLFYESNNRTHPDYFLSKCERILKKNLPVYDWR